MRIKVISFHGLYSRGDNLETLTRKLTRDLREQGHKVISVQHDYPKLNATMGFFSWSRDIVRDYMYKCLQLEESVNQGWYTIVITHSNATWGISRVIGKYMILPTSSVKQTISERPFHIDRLVLFGSTIKRNYDWSRYPLDVINFVGTKDRVVLFAKLFKMGWSGRKGFKLNVHNLKQIFNPWKHSDFVLEDNYDLIKNVVLRGLRKEKV